MKVTLIQLGYGEGSGESVEQRAARAAGLVRTYGAGAGLVMLPELWSAGGFASSDWLERSQPLDGPLPPALEPLAGAVAEIGAVLHTGSVVERSPQPGPEGRQLWNTSVILGPDGDLVARYRKIHRFGFAGGEPKLMEAGDEVVATRLPAPADALKAGLSTCYDLRFPELYRRLVDAGSEMFLIPSAWPLARVEAWRLLLRARAIENQCFVLACNTAGEHAGVAMGGYSAIIDPAGAVLAEAGTGQEVLSAEIDPGQVAQLRRDFPVLADRRL